MTHFISCIKPGAAPGTQPQPSVILIIHSLLPVISGRLAHAITQKSQMIQTLWLTRLGDLKKELHITLLRKSTPQWLKQTIKESEINQKISIAGSMLSTF